MVRTAFAAALAAAGWSTLAAGTTPPTMLPAEELFELRSKSVFVVHVFDKEGRRTGIGSAVVIGPEQVITNCHVVEKASGVGVSRGNVSFGASLEFADPERDLCQLKVPELYAPAVPLGSVTGLRVGQRVYAIGAPQGLELTLSDGLVSSLRVLEEGAAPLIQTSTPIAPGSSGGGLFNGRGELVGVTTFGFRGEQLNFAVPSDWIREVPERGRALLARRKQAAEARALAAAQAATPGAAVVALAPIDPSLPREMPQPGDTWTYVARDMMYRPNDRSRKFVHMVRSVTRDSIVEVVTAQGAPPSEADHSAKIGALYRPSAEVLEVAPFLTAFGTPQPGQRWSGIPIRGTEHVRVAGGETAYVLERARVVRVERVTVPAGTFEAIRIDFDGYMSNYIVFGPRSVTPGHSPFKQTVWYAPPVKRAVKVSFDGPRISNVYELESYSLH